MSQGAAPRKILLLFGINVLDEVLNKGNIWYVRNYEAYFDRVYVAYLLGQRRPILRNGRTVLIPLGRGNPKIDLLLAPWRIYHTAKRVSATSYLTADLIFSWWTSLLVQWLLGAIVYLLPVCMPEVIYRSGGRSMSGLPLWLEQISIWLSFRRANRIWTGHAFGGFVGWLSQHPLARNKLVISHKLVEALSTEGFFRRLEAQQRTSAARQAPADGFVLVYVGRLHREKMVSDLIEMMAAIREQGPLGIRPVLWIIGDGPERESLEQLAKDRDVKEDIVFLGAVPNEDLPIYLCKADVFVSPLTGSALREAALCGLPIVAYDMDWVSALFRNGDTALLVPPGDVVGLAAAVRIVATDPALRERLAQNAKTLGWLEWSPAGVRESLEEVFGQG
jgi:glycosyltransferase involved in cell wall biosynthesis